MRVCVEYVLSVDRVVLVLPPFACCFVCHVCCHIENAEIERKNIKCENSGGRCRNG